MAGAFGLQIALAISSDGIYAGLPLGAAVASPLAAHLLGLWENNAKFDSTRWSVSLEPCPGDDVQSGEVTAVVFAVGFYILHWFSSY